MLRASPSLRKPSFHSFGPVVGVAAAEEVVPDVLGLPEVDLEGHGAEGVGDGEGGLEGGAGGGSPVGGGFEADHGALHALAGGEAEDGDVEGDLVGGGAGEQGFDLGGVELVGFEGAAEAGVDGEAGGEGEGGRRGHAGLGEEVEEGGVVLVDLAEGVLHLGEGAVEDGAEDAVLLVGEERGEGVGEGAEEAVDEADDFGEVGAADGGADVGGEGGRRRRRRRGRRRCSGLTAAERFWSPRWRTAKQISSVSSVMRERMRARPRATLPRPEVKDSWESRWTSKQKSSPSSG